MVLGKGSTKAVELPEELNLFSFFFSCGSVCNNLKVITVVLIRRSSRCTLVLERMFKNPLRVCIRRGQLLDVKWLTVIPTCRLFTHSGPGFSADDRHGSPELLNLKLFKLQVHNLSPRTWITLSLIHVSLAGLIHTGPFFWTCS